MSQKFKKNKKQNKSSAGKNSNKSDLAFGQTREERWLKKFDAAAPKSRYDMTLEMLKQTPLIIRGDDLLYVMASLNEILLFFNCQDELEVLMTTLEVASKKEYKKLKPVFDVFSLNKALYIKDTEGVESVLIGWWSHLDREFMGPLSLALDHLYHYGHHQLASKTAQVFYNSLSQRKHQLEEFRFQCGDFLIADALKSYAAGEQDAEQFKAALAGLEVPKTEIPRIFSHLEMTGPEHLAQFKEKLSASPDDLLVHLQFPFSQAMATQGFHFYTSGEMVTSAFSFLFHQEEGDDMPENVFEFALDDLQDFISFLVEAYPETHLPFVLLWGLSHLYQWLNKQELISEALFSESLSHIKAARLNFLESNAQGAWNYAYVLNWPRIEGEGTEQIQAEEAVFKNSFEAQETLSDDPEMSKRFEMNIDPLPKEEVAEIIETLHLIQSQYGEVGLESYLKDLEKEIGEDAVAYILSSAGGALAQ